MRPSELLFIAAAVYVLVGLVIAIAFAFKFAAKVDHNTEGAGLPFRVLIIPGCAALWPLILFWIAGHSRTTQSEEPAQ